MIENIVKAPGRVWRLLRDLVIDREEAYHRYEVRARLLRLWIWNRVSRASLVGRSHVIVCMTTFGPRIETAYYALESIRLGSARPMRVILWIDDRDQLAALPRPLRRLQRRGLEIRHCENFGPHKKQYPYAISVSPHRYPLVTADDDVMYPKGWLAGLLNSYESDPALVQCYRSRRVLITSDVAFEPYEDWPLNETDRPSIAVMPTGVGGVLYPPSVLDILAREGTRFLEVAPTADDIWVHSLSSGHDIQARQVKAVPEHPWIVPGSQIGSLTSQNVDLGQNDVQLGRAYTTELRARLALASQELLEHTAPADL